jgi:hypothetical protein
MSELPVRPSAEHLRKQAKRAARQRSIRLAEAQRLLANEYGHRTWAQLMAYVARAGAGRSSPLFAAVRSGDVATLRRLLAGGANPNLGDGTETPLHVAARRGPLTVVEALIAGGALEWQTDARGRLPLDVARSGRSHEKSSIVALLDRTTIADPSFRAAVAAIHAGDVVALGRLIDAEPRLLRERILGPAAFRLAARHQYFLDPKLFWFIANNPTIVERMPANIVEVARAMTGRGVDGTDLDYALELTMTSRSAREQGHQLPLVRALIAAGAKPTREALIGAAAYFELDILRALVDDGFPMSAPLAAALSANQTLRNCLATADAADVQTAFGLAVINRNLEGARAALDAGADVNAFLPVHAHSTALHQAAVNDDAALIDFLLARGARPDVPDKLWDATALDWAIHEGKPAAQAALEAALPRTDAN